MNLSAWIPAVVFGALTWALFARVAKTSIGGDTTDWIVGALGIASALTAGAYVQGTAIGGLIRWLVGIPVARVVLLIVILMVMLFTVIALLPNKVNSSVTASLGLAMAWTAVPSAVAAGAIGGTVGGQLAALVTQASATALSTTAGWFA